MTKNKKFREGSFVRDVIHTGTELLVGQVFEVMETKYEKQWNGYAQTLIMRAYPVVINENDREEWCTGNSNAYVLVQKKDLKTIRGQILVSELGI